LCFSSISASIHSAKNCIHSLVAMFGNVSKGKCLPSDFAFLDSFPVFHHCRRIKEITMVLCKPPTAPRLKVNTDGSVIGGYVACGGMFRDHSGTFCGAFTCNTGLQSVFHAEILGFILAIQYAAQKV